MRRAEPKEPLKKLPRRRISFREAFTGSPDGAYIQRVELMVTREISVGKGQRQSLEGTRPHRLLQSPQNGHKRNEPEYIKSRSKSEGRVGTRPITPVDQRRKRPKTPNKAQKSRQRTATNKSTILIREEAASQKKERPKSKKNKAGLNKTTNDRLRSKIEAKKTVTPLQQKRPNEAPLLKKKCMNMIHNRYLLEKKMQERIQAATKIQAWVRGHLVRRRLQDEYNKMVHESGLFDKPFEGKQSNPHQASWMVKWKELSALTEARNTISNRIAKQSAKCKLPAELVGLDTSWYAVYQYLRALKSEVKIRYRVLFERCIQQPFGLQPVQRLKLLSDSLEEWHKEEPLVLPDELFDAIEQRLQSSNYERMHHQAIFDCYNQSVTRSRPYFNTFGQPYPWVTHKIEYPLSYGEAVKAIDDSLQTNCTTLCGLIIDVDNSSEWVEGLLAAKRQKLLEGLLKHWLSTSQPSWINIQDERTEVLLHVSNHLTTRLIGEFAKQLASISYIRKFV